MHSCLGGKTIQCYGYKPGYSRNGLLPGNEPVADIQKGAEENYKRSSLDSISCQRSSYVASDGTAEGDAGEGVRAKTVNLCVSVGTARYLVSFGRQMGVYRAVNSVS